MTQAIERHDDKETESDATQRRKDRLHANSTHEVPQQQRAPNECDRLRPGDRTSVFM